MTYTHGREFVRETLGILQLGHGPALLNHLARRWPREQLCALLACGHEDAAKVALLGLSLTGTMADVSDVTRMLSDDDAFTAALAEQAAWSIWFRAGDPEANATLIYAVEELGDNRLDDALGRLVALVERCPDFAEARNQLAVARFLRGEYAPAIDECRRVLELNPHHFGALAGLGHCHAALGRLEPALDAYYASLRINPRMEGIRQSIQRVRRHARRRAHTLDP